MKRFIVLFSLLFTVYGSAIDLFGNFSLSGDGVFYFQSATPSVKNTLPAAQKGFGEVLDLEFEYKGGFFSFYTRFHNGNGSGGDKVFADYLFANVNTMADDNTDDNYDLKLLEAYLSFNFFEDRLNIIVGKTEPFLFIDQNEFANDEISQFIGKPFVNNIFFDVEDRYSPLVGFNFSFEKIELSGYVQSIEKHNVFFDGREWVIEETGVHDFSTNISTGFQLNFKTDIRGLKGNYRFFVYNNSFSHFRYNADLYNPNKKPNTVSASGFGLSFDQYVAESLGLFARFGKSYNRLHDYDNFYSLGFYLGNLFSSKDSIMCAFTKINSSSESKVKDEKHFEVQYRYNLSENLLAAFDYQYVQNLKNYPKADLSVFTIRLTLFF